MVVCDRIVRMDFEMKGRRMKKFVLVVAVAVAVAVFGGAEGRMPISQAGNPLYLTWCASAVALNGMTYEHDYAKPGVRVFFNLHKPVPRVVGTAPSIGCCEYYCPPGLMLLIW